MKVAKLKLNNGYRISQAVEDPDDLSWLIGSPVIDWGNLDPIIDSSYVHDFNNIFSAGPDITVDLGDLT